MARIGESLTNARLRRGLSIEQAAGETRIAARFIEALESEDFGALPAPVYVRGFLRSYATFLRIDPAALLSQLPEDGGPRVASPESFVGGPAGGRVPGQRRVDPFQRPEPQIQTQRGAPERPSVRNASPADPMPAEQYEAEPAFVASVPPARRRGVVPRDEYPEEEARFRSKPAGVLIERRLGADDGAAGGRVLLLAGVGVFVLLAVLAGAVFVTSRGGGNGGTPAVSLQDGATATLTARGGVVIPVGSATATPPGGTPGATTTAVTVAAGTPATPGAPTPTTAPGQPTATPQPRATATQGTEPTATPSATPTAAPTLAPTSTPTTAATPTPQATATPAIAHPFGYAECLGGDCGPSPYRVICAPDGFFIDNPNVGGVFNNRGGWRETTVPRAGDAAKAC